ncbi:MAG: DUF4962 domain-containing protein [Candidatus Glassbacteria bacterium]
MKALKWNSLAAIVCLVCTACGSRTESPVPACTAPARRIEALAGVHPRLLVTGATVERLRPELGTTHRWLWERFREDLPRMVQISRREIPLDDVRYDGDLAAELAFAWLMTGDDSLLAIARQQVLRLTDPASWQAPGSLVYLIGSHFLCGIALAYDWLYPALSEPERTQISGCLGREAQAQYESIVSGRIWWRNQYYQNHSHSNYCGLAFAAAALYGEDERTGQWLGVCEQFFARIFEVMPEDGSSVEGYAYAGYGGEYILKYAMLSRDLLGKDYTDNPWMKNYAGYMLHGLLPYCTERKWAMTFGDGPHRGWTSTAQHLFLLARLNRDPAAQWMARFTTELRERGLGDPGWMKLLYYDPQVPEADPTVFPTQKYFPEIGQVMMRSSWTDTAGTLVGFKCGPFMGRRYSAGAEFDWGTGHAEPDAGSFQLFSHGQFLALNALYTGFKLTGNHNTMLFKGRGQLGDELTGFASSEALAFGHCPQVLRADSNPRYDYAVGDVARAYHPALGLKRYLRHLLFVKPDILLVADQISLEEKGNLYNYRCFDIQTGPGLSHNEYGQVTGSQGEAFVIFDGVPGTYRIYACYLDNAPGAADYALEVDGRTVHAWKSDNADRDDNLLVQSPPVRLAKGSRIALRGSSLPEQFRLTKLAAYSEDVSVPRQARWLQHFDPQTVVARKGSHVSARLEGAALDLYPLAPAGSAVKWERYEILKAEVEPFNYRETVRLSIEPKFTGSDLTLVNLLHTRSAAGPELEGVEAVMEGGLVKARWIKDGKAVSLSWDLEKQEVVIYQ